MSAKWRKKPVVVEAVRLEDNRFAIIDAVEFVFNRGLTSSESDSDIVVNNIMGQGGLVIPTLEGDMKANFGDYIIKGIKGEFYPCKPDIFHATYERQID